MHFMTSAAEHEVIPKRTHVCRQPSQKHTRRCLQAQGRDLVLHVHLAALLVERALARDRVVNPQALRVLQGRDEMNNLTHGRLTD